MKQFSSLELERYNTLMFQVGLQIHRLGTQKAMALRLGIHPSTLNKALRGVITLDSRTFVRLLELCGFDILKGIKISNGVIYPGMVL